MIMLLGIILIGQITCVGSFPTQTLGFENVLMAEAPLISEKWQQTVWLSRTAPLTEADLDGDLGLDLPPYFIAYDGLCCIDIGLEDLMIKLDFEHHQSISCEVIDNGPIYHVYQAFCNPGTTPSTHT